MRAMNGRARELLIESLAVFGEDVAPFAKEAAACITLDGWSSRANKHYMAFLLVTMTANFDKVRIGTDLGVGS